jgi:molecular chaperone DnaK
MIVIIPKNSHYGQTYQHVFTTSRDNQTSIVFYLYEGEHPVALDNSLIAEYEVDNLSTAPAGHLHISVSMVMDTRDKLQVTKKSTRAAERGWNVPFTGKAS